MRCFPPQRAQHSVLRWLIPAGVKPIRGAVTIKIDDVARDVMTKLKAGQSAEAGAMYWAEHVSSHEAMRGGHETKGKAAVQAKAAAWAAAHEVHKMDVSGPYIHGTQFGLRIVADLTVKESGKRVQMDEFAIYIVHDSKITEERFFYLEG